MSFEAINYSMEYDHIITGRFRNKDLNSNEEVKKEF